MRVASSSSGQSIKNAANSVIIRGAFALVDFRIRTIMDRTKILVKKEAV
jgi:hypothetical protein